MKHFAHTVYKRLHEILVLTSNDIMIEKKQTIYEKLSDNNIKKYKKIRYVLI